MVNIAKIYSTLGNSNSLIPLAVKDISATAGMTAGSFVTGKEEGQDRFIDEIGTEAIWLLGIPGFKWLFDNTIFRGLGLDARFDARNLRDEKVFEKIKEYSPNDKIKKNLEKISDKKTTFKNAAVAKFFVSTGLAIASYIGLTNFKQKFTEKKIRENLIAEYNAGLAVENEPQKDQASKAPSFKGVGSAIESFAFNPVKNMWILDGAITGERLVGSRSPQEFIGYAIKEASTLFFMYYAGGKIQELLEKNATQKHNKSISLDARVLEDEMLKNAFKDGSIEKDIEVFRKECNSKPAMYDFLHNKSENIVVKTAKKSDIVKMYKKTDKIDTRKYIDFKEFVSVGDKIEELYKQYCNAIKQGESSDKFFEGVKKLKRKSIVMNIGTCILALGVITPAIMLLKRLAGKDDKEFETKKEIREQLIKEGVIV